VAQIVENFWNPPQEILSWHFNKNISFPKKGRFDVIINGFSDEWKKHKPFAKLSCLIFQPYFPIFLRTRSIIFEFTCLTLYTPGQPCLTVTSE